MSATTRKLAARPWLGELSRDLVIRPAPGGFELAVEVWEIDRRGDKDAYVEPVSFHATLTEAEAALTAYPGRPLARAA